MVRETTSKPRRYRHLRNIETVGITEESCPHFFKLPVRPQKYLLALLMSEHKFNQQAAYRAAGYKSKNSGSRFFRDPTFMSAFSEVLNIVGAIPSWIQFRLAEVAAGASMQDLEPYIKGEKDLETLAAQGVNVAAVKSAQKTVDSRGNAVTKIELYDPLPALKALMQALGMVTEKREVKVDGNFEHAFKDMSDQELARAEHACRTDTEEVGETEEASATADTLGEGPP
jgi:hypothetical protein